MSIFYTVVLTLIIYSIISTIVITLTHKNEDVIAVFGFGIVGCLLILLSKIIFQIRKFCKFHINKRSVFEETSTGKRYKCKTQYTNDIKSIKGYKLIARYATKSEWKNIPDFPKELIDNYKACRCDEPDCVRNKSETISESDQLAKK